jgi:pyridinium-3,5-biscarboxylic acid mononucleotide sulfurtransferase
MGQMSMTLEARRERLRRALNELPGLVVAYSGGVDSTFLAHAAHEVLGDRLLAVTAVSPSLAASERRAAAALAQARGWRHMAVETHEIDRPDYRRNFSDRCYWCKTELFEVVAPIAVGLGHPIAVGTNLDDLGDHRPGQQAAREKGALMPLVDAGLTKSDVRRLSAEEGLPTATKPAAPCLASRIAYGVEVTPERLARVDAAEDYLRSLGFAELRVRDHGDVARVEVPAADIPSAAARAEEIAERLAELGFAYTTLDLKGLRSGSLNEILPESALRIGLPR